MVLQSNLSYADRCTVEEATRDQRWSAPVVHVVVDGIRAGRVAAAGAPDGAATGSRCAHRCVADVVVWRRAAALQCVVVTSDGDAIPASKHRTRPQLLQDAICQSPQSMLSNAHADAAIEQHMSFITSPATLVAALHGNN